MDNLTADDFKEVTEAEKAKIEAQDAQWVRPPQSLIDEWEAAGKIGTRWGNTDHTKQYTKYNPVTGYFELDYGVVKITDITAEEAIRTLRWGSFAERNAIMNGPAALRFESVDIRGTIPSMAAVNENYPSVGWHTQNLKVIKWSYDASQTYKCSKLSVLYNVEYILDIIQPSSYPFVVGSNNNSQSLALKLVYLKSINGDINAMGFPALLAETFRYMIDNAINTTPITISVHPEVYSKLNDPENSEWYELNQNAQEKQIAFATT